MEFREGGGGGEEVVMMIKVTHHQDHQKKQIVRSNNNNNNKMKKIVKGIGLFAAAVVTCFVLYQSTNSFRSFPHSPFSLPFKHHAQLKELEKILEKAATSDKTVILTTINKAWAAPNSIFDLFLESFRIGNQTQKLLNHLVVVAMDQNALDLCFNLHSNCFLLNNVGSNFSSEAYFMSSEYLSMMWKRIDFLHQILAMGYSFVFTDVDIMWFRNPFPHFYQEADFQIACDYYWGNPSDLNNAPNGGFNYVKSNKKTIEFYEFWYRSKDVHPGMHDQDVLNSIKHDPYIKKIGLDIKFFDTANFGGFCQPSQDLNNVVTMHANCCVGLDNKIYDLKIMLEDWRKYVALSQNSTTEHASSWTVPQRCGAASFGHRNQSD